MSISDEDFAALVAKVNAIKAKTDTIGGAGAIPWTYTVTNENTGAPIADVRIWITTDLAGTNVVATGRTDDRGQATFYLDEGTVYVWRKKTQIDFDNPDAEEIEET